MRKENIYRKAITVIISAVWLINGLFCKLLNFVPRHQLIVTEILGEGIAFYATKAIGIAEILMFVWILSRYKSRFCAIVQIIVILSMNIMEFILVPELLLFGRFNILTALFLCIVIFINELFVTEKLSRNESA